MVAPEYKTANSVDFSVTEHLSDTAGQEEPRGLSPIKGLLICQRLLKLWSKGS